MRLLKTFSIFIIFICQASFSQQDTVNVDPSAFSIDYIMGPYLMVDHHLYKSVFMQGARINYETGFAAYGIEYLVGMQEDETGELGTTHSVSAKVDYFLLKNSLSRFRPYAYIGGGFFEFKDFSKDKLGVAFYTGLGSEFNFSSVVKGFIEGRYLNLGPLKLDGKNEIGVFWGIRVKF